MSKKMLAPLVTAIVPVTKMAGRLDRMHSWLKSVSDLDLEVIIVHDKQDEETGLELAKICKSLQNPDVHLVEKYSGSPGFTRNEGLARSSGDWICFWDSDDLPCPDKILESLRGLDSRTEVVIGQFELVENLTGKSTYTSNDRTLSEIVANPGIWRMIFKSRILEDAKFTKFHLGEDQLLLIQVNPENRRIMFSEEVFYKYFLGNIGQLTSQKEKIGDLFEVCKITSGIIINDKNSNYGFTLLLFSKMILTCMKLGLLKIKICSVAMYFETYRKATWANRRLMLKSMISILRKSTYA